MSAEKPVADNESNVASGGTLVGRSAMYREIYASLNRIRLGVGDFSIVFATASDTLSGPAASPTNTIVEETRIVLSWSALKTLAISLQEAVDVIEEERGPIFVTRQVITQAAGRKAQLRAILKELDLS